jgi:hypothetical protein
VPLEILAPGDRPLRRGARDRPARARLDAFDQVLLSARAQGTKLGRPRIAVDLGRAVAMRSEDKSMRTGARALGVSAMAVSRALAELGTRNPMSDGAANARQHVNG